MRVSFLLCAAPLLALLLAAIGGVAAAPQSVVVASPDGRLRITCEARAGGPAYRVEYNGATLVSDSALGLELAGAAPLGPGTEIVGVDRAARNGTWRRVVGKSAAVRDHYNGAVVHLREKAAPHRRLDIALRAYDDGVAFRYLWPRQPGLGRFQIAAERTEFRFPADYTAWALSPGYHTYESEYRKETLDALQADKLQPLPILMTAGEGRWLALTEADLHDYAGLYVKRDSNAAHALIAALPPNREDKAIAVETQAPGESPWRVIMVGDAPGRLIESNLILNLARPCKIADTSWIKPGASAWNWWSGTVVDDPAFLAAGNKPGMNTATINHYTDFAAAMHLPYNLVDAGWYRENDITTCRREIDIPAVVQHAKEKGVRIVVWIHSDLANKQMDRAFPLYEKWGVAGVKIDFMDSDDQPMVDFYERALKLAAAHHLVVDFHGAFKPTGLNRTWPNELTREGVLGMEYDKWSKRADPEHNVTIPFTRMLCGPMDYTPGGFTNEPSGDYTPRDTRPIVPTTRAQQLAMYVVYESPLQMVSDYPENILGKPGAPFLVGIPTSWDETRVLNGMPGEYVTVARKHGVDWYLGAMTNGTARTLELPLRFLGRGRYTAEIYQDDPAGTSGPAHLATRTKGVTASDTLKAELAAGGGFAVRFVPAR